MINGQREIWISTGNKSNYSSTIIAVSNCGRIMRKNGKIEIASYRQLVCVREQRQRLRMRVYQFLANNFIVKTEDDILKRRTVIDHITHTPDNMYINDVRNLRWCTQKENCNFKEAKLNNSKAKIGNTFAKGNTNVRGRSWYNNGITSIRANECPPGFTHGRITKKKRAAK